MTQPARRPLPHARGGPEFVVAVADEGYEKFVAARAALARTHKPPIRFVRVSSLADPDHEADLVIAHYRPSAPDRRMLFSTEAHEIYEQDASGLIYRDTVRLCSVPPVAFGNPRTRRDGTLQALHEAALLFTEPAGYQWLVKLCAIGRLVDLVALPRTGGGFVPDGWLERAHDLMAPFPPDIAPAPGLP